MSRRSRRPAPPADTAAIEAARADAVAQTSAAILNALTNTMTGAGTQDDPTQAWQPQLPTALQTQQLNALWSADGLAARICAIKPTWVAQAGIVVTSEPDDLSDLDQDYRVSTELGQAMTWANLYGGGGVLVAVDGDDDWSRPWVPAEGQRVRLIAVDGVALQPDLSYQVASWAQEPDLPPVWRDFADPREPRYYRLQPSAVLPGLTAPLHWTRVLPVRGHPLPPGAGYSTAATLPAWQAVSLLRLVWANIASTHGTRIGLARIAQRLAVYLATYPALANRTYDPSGAITSGLTTWAQSMTAGSTVAAPPGYDLKPVALPLSGLSDLTQADRSALCAASGLPESLLFGTAPSGLNTDGESWRTAWGVECSTAFDRVRPAVARILVGLAVVTTGAAPERLQVEMGDLWRASGTSDAARTAAARAEVVELLKAAIIDREEARSLLRDAGMELPEIETEPEVVLPDTPTDSNDAPDFDAPASEPIAEVSLNGAQVTSLIDIIAQVGARTLPASAARELIAVAYPSIPEARIARLISAVAAAPPIEPESGAPAPLVPAADADAERYTIPDGASGSAAKVLRWEEEHGNAVPPGTATGRARARQLAAGGTISEADLTEIRAWFARHGAQSATRTVAPEFKDEPWRDAGYVAWLRWGGDTMRSYAERTGRADADWSGAGLVALSDLPPAVVEAWTAARDAVIVAGVALEGYDPGDPPPDEPHITLTYLGAVRPAALPPLVEALAEAARVSPAPILRPSAVVAFPSGPISGPTRRAVVVELRPTGALASLSAAVLRAAAPHVTADQHVQARYHMTLGFAPASDDLDDVLSAVEVPAVAARARYLTLSWSGEEIARWDLREP